MIRAYRLLFTVALTLLFNAHELKAQQTDFSGTWIRNTEKSDAGDFSMNSIPVSITVSQSKTQIEITRNSKDRLGDSSSYTEILKFDGSLSTSVVKPNLNKKSKIEWSVDQQSLSGSADYTDDSGKPLQKGHDSWTLLDYGMTLQIRFTLESDGQIHELIEVFNRK